ncbi:MAG: hypothetical protein MRZ50_01530 [Prevotella sp.]|nr:hypothetical protein [Prevotella sp.]
MGPVTGLGLYLPEFIAVIPAETVPRGYPNKALTVLNNTGNDPMGQPGMDVIGGCVSGIDTHYIQTEQYYYIDRLHS